MKYEINKKFALLRIKNDLSLSKMADFLEISEIELGDFENGTKSIDSSLLERSCDLFGCSLKSLANIPMEKMNPCRVPYDLGLLNRSELKTVAAIQKIVINLKEMDSLSSSERTS